MLEADANTISSCPLFKGIKTTDIQKIFKSISYSAKRYTKGSLIMIRGDEYESLKILLEGEVSAEIQNFSGKTVKIENLKAPNALALGILFAQNNTLPVTIVAQTNLKLISIPKDSIIKMAQKNENFLVNYFTESGNKVAFLAEKLRMFKFSTLRQKLTRYVLSLSKKQKSKTITLTHNREALAEIFGVARPSLSRVCSEMSEEGLLRISGKKITLLNIKALKDSLT